MSVAGTLLAFVSLGVSPGGLRKSLFAVSADGKKLADFVSAELKNDVGSVLYGLSDFRAGVLKSDEKGTFSVTELISLHQDVKVKYDGKEYTIDEDGVQEADLEDLDEDDTWEENIVAEFDPTKMLEFLGKHKPTPRAANDPNQVNVIHHNEIIQLNVDAVNDLENGTYSIL